MALDGPPPRLVLLLPQVPTGKEVVDQHRQAHVQHQLYVALESSGFQIERLHFGEQSALAGKVAWLLALDAKGILHAAEAEGLPMKRLVECTLWGQDCRCERWEAFELHDGDDPEDLVRCLTSAEVLTLLQARAYHAVLPSEQPPMASDFPALDFLAQRHSVLALAEHVGAVTVIAGLHDAGARELLRRWPALWDVGARLPLDDVVKYFGIHTAEYFLFLQDYAVWLWVPTLLGLVATVAPPWFSSIFMVLTCLWSTLFIEHWKRKHWELSHRFGNPGRMLRAYDAEAPASFQIGQECLREALAANGVAPHAHDVSAAASLGTQEGVDEPGEIPLLRSPSRTALNSRFLARPPSPRTPFQAVLFLHGHLLRAVLPMCGLVAMVMAVIHSLLWVGQIAEKRFESVILQNLPCVVYLGVAFYLEQFYLWVVGLLARIEEIPLYSEHLKSVTTKAALFQLVNYLGWFVYVAFWMQDIEYLRSQLFMFMTVKQAISLCSENVAPQAARLAADLKRCLLSRRRGKKLSWADSHVRGAPPGGLCTSGGLRRRRFVEVPGSRQAGPSAEPGACASSEAEEVPRVELSELEKQMQLERPDLGSEYLQLAVLFAATTAFAVAFPLGPLFALLHTYISRWSDAKKLLKFNRRAAPAYADVVVSQAWLGIFEAISMCAVVTNFSVLAVSGGWGTRQLAVVEHLILVFKVYLAWSIPDQPHWVHQVEVAYEEMHRYGRRWKRS